ncbi:flippase [Nakamurella antarctica]|uniref:Flippase n=1 Tax=Nakamurella antarctica TaxID=1902245 RepID=A0A3G8ZTI5_9ACTN|nr:polysaccharide biosynthesis C-terminal domain-containing protein [Nakamurella antarctica]AZI57356.1 flippase [Nakamurella antarctica]
MSKTVDAEDSQRGSESGSLARGGLASFGGAAISAVMGFALTFVLARGLGEAGSGVVLQATAIFAITVSIGKLGMDSAAIWLMPRLLVDARSEIRSAVNFLFAISAAAGILAGILISLVGPVVIGDSAVESRELGSSLVALGWAVPVAVLVLVALAAIRGLGKLLPYVAIGSIALPAARPIAVLLSLWFAGSALAAVWAWAAPLPFALVGALVLLGVQIRKLTAGTDRGRRKNWPSRERRSQILGFALPRTLSAGLEQSLLWLDLILVGALAGASAAGIYGGASRFIAAGLIVDTALRVVVSPQFSSLLHRGDIPGVQRLYGTAATWLVLFSTPIYIVLAIYAPTILGWLGPGFAAGSHVLVILSVGAVITFAAGNIHSVLLMSGRSGWAAFNKAIVLAVNVAGNLVLVPVMGIEGAALSWAASMMIDACMAAFEVHRFLGVNVDASAVAYGLLVPSMCVGIPAGVFRTFYGSHNWTLALSVALGGVLLAVWCRLDAHKLKLSDLRARPGRG